VGNLVCPAEFELGEHKKVMILSVTEGDDKPLKYPLMFQKSSVLIINKIDLLPYVTCDVDKIKRVVRELNPQIEIFEVSCKTGEGIDQWLEWLKNQISSFKQ
jgi:hydrogenase nickel incorporation protein HypB